jgi:hypothetical protein
MYKVAVVEFLGVSPTTAVGAAIVLHAVSFVPVTLLGLYFMAREGLSFGRMRELARDTQTEGAPQGRGPSVQRGGETKGAPPSGVIK